MRGLAFVLVLLGCADPRPPAPPPAAPADENVVEHDEPQIEARGRELYEETRRREEQEQIRAKIRSGAIVCTPTDNKIHGPSASCVDNK